MELDVEKKAAGTVLTKWIIISRRDEMLLRALWADNVRKTAGSKVKMLYYANKAELSFIKNLKK